MYDNDPCGRQRSRYVTHDMRVNAPCVPRKMRTRERARGRSAALGKSIRRGGLLLEPPLRLALRLALRLPQPVLLPSVGGGLRGPAAPLEGGGRGGSSYVVPITMSS